MNGVRRGKYINRYEMSDSLHWAERKTVERDNKDWAGSLYQIQAMIVNCCIKYKQRDVSGRWRDSDNNKQSWKEKLKLSPDFIH